MATHIKLIVIKRYTILNVNKDVKKLELSYMVVEI